MFLTNEILIEYGAVDNDRKMFCNLYPNGTELLNLFKNKDIPKSFIFWIEENLPINSKEIEKFLEICNIKNSALVYQSYNVEESNLISYSNDVYSSEKIRNSHFVYNSNNCDASRDIEESSFITESSEISNSIFCINSQNVEKSSDISRSLNITESEHIFQSKFVIKSKVVYNSNMIENCFFSSFMENSKNCLFCSGLDFEEYMLFNKPISKPVYDQILRSLLIKLKHEKIELYLQGENDFSRVIISPKFSFTSFFQEISPNFWDWVKTLPNFDDFVLYNITFREGLLN